MYFEELEVANEVWELLVWLRVLSGGCVYEGEDNVF